MNMDRIKIEDLEYKLNTWVIINNNSKFIDYQLDMFSTDNNTNGRCNISWSSPKQVIPLFESLGFNLTVLDKKTKKIKKICRS